MKVQTTKKQDHLIPNSNCFERKKEQKERAADSRKTKMQDVQTKTEQTQFQNQDPKEMSH